MKKFLGLVVIVLSLITACKKSDPYDVQKQLAKDEELIKEFIAKNNIPATRDTTGVYYVISDPGSGSITYTANTNVKVKYKLRLLNGTEIPQGTDAINLTLGNVIAGWRIGIPKIQPGGKIRLIIPSVWAYGPNQAGEIPANSVLDFDIELVSVNSVN